MIIDDKKDKIVKQLQNIREKLNNGNMVGGRKIKA